MSDASPVRWSVDDAFPTHLDHRRGTLALDAAYTVGDDGVGLCYSPSDALEASVPFAFGFAVPTTWLPHQLHRPDSGRGDLVFACTLGCDDAPDCVYRCGLFAHVGGGGGGRDGTPTGRDAWEVVCDGPEWTAGELTMPVPTAAVAAVYAAHRNRTLVLAGKPVADPAFVVGFTRVEFGQPPGAHTLHLDALSLALGGESHDGGTAGSGAHQVTTVLTAIRSREQLAQPVAVLTETALAPYVGLGADHPVAVDFLLRGTCTGVTQLDAVFQPTNYPPTVLPVLVANGTFAVAGRPVFPSTVTVIELRLQVRTEADAGPDVGTDEGTDAVAPFAIDITDLQATPSAAWAQGGGGGGDRSFGGVVSAGDGPSLHDAIDFGTIAQLKQKVEQLADVTQALDKAQGPVGPLGKRGPKGERGEPLRFEDLSSDQQEAVRGKRGPAGPRGKPMVFEDLTGEQRGLLKGEKGNTGDTGRVGDRGARGHAGKCFAFDDLTDVQRALLKGQRGEKGDRGDALAFEDLSDGQKQLLKGQRGEKGHAGDLGERGDRGRVGPIGPVGAEGKQGPRGLPGIPGAKGDKGHSGQGGRDGTHGRAAVIKTAFASAELLRDFVTKSLHLTPNTYYLIDQPDHVGSDDAGGGGDGDVDVDGGHGTLYAYTGELDLELVVGCTYVDNLKGVFDEFQTLLRAQVQTDADEWRVSVTVRSNDVGVYHLRRGLENSIVQSGYAVKESTVTDDALQVVGRLCGVRGHSGVQGAQGAPGQSMLGMRLDYVGTEATRLKLRAPEPNTVFLQVQPSKSSVAGFYMHDGSQWRLLHGVDVADSFLQWMAAFVDNPNQESIPLVLSMFATTKKQMDGNVLGVRQELSEYRSTNEKWKKFQFEHWKSMGNSQYQQFNTQLSEQAQQQESLVQQVQGVTEKAVGREELAQLRKLVEKQVEHVERQCKGVKRSVADFTDRQTVDKHVFEQEQESVQSKLRDVDASMLKMLKIIQYLKTAPWTKPAKQLRQDLDQLALEHTTHRAEQTKRNREVQAYLDKEFPEALKGVQAEVGAVLEKLASSDVALDRKFVDWGDTYDKRLLGVITDGTDATMRVQKELLAHADKTRAEVVAQLTSKLYVLKQEVLESTNELREGAHQHEHDTKRALRTTEKRVDEVEATCEAAIKKQHAQHDATWKEACDGLRARIDLVVDKTTKDTDRKLLQTVDALQQERRETGAKQAEQAKDLAAALTETKTDLLTTDERWAERFEDQRQKHTALVDHHVERLRAELLKHAQEHATAAAEQVQEAAKDGKQRYAQLAYELKAACKRVTDVDAKLQEDVDRQTSAARTHADERSRELDQKYSNAVQGLTNDVQGVEAKCNNVDYMLKARLESVEEHIQQLYTEGQQQCETMVDKNKKETVQTIEAMRNDVVGQQQKAGKTVAEQMRRYETSYHEKHQAHADHLERLDGAVAALRKTDEAHQAQWTRAHEQQAVAMQALRTDLQESVREVVLQMERNKDEAARELQEAKRDVLAQLHSKHDDVATKGAEAQQELEERVRRQYETRSRDTEGQLKQLRTVLEDMCAHVDGFTAKESAQRQVHEQRLQQVVGLLEKTFAEMVEQ